MFVAVLLVSGIHALDPHFVSVCGVRSGSLDTNLCPDGGAEPERLDLVQVSLVGALGGLLAGNFPVANARSVRSPWGLLSGQLILKVMSGAVTALIGVLLEKGVLAGMSVQAGSKIVAYAAFFGFAQLALTALVDRRAGQLATATQPKGTAAAPSGT
jgi:hypothetical protein